MQRPWREERAHQLRKHRAAHRVDGQVGTLSAGFLHDGIGDATTHTVALLHHPGGSELEQRDGALVAALGVGFETVARRLLALGADVNGTDASGTSVLAAATALVDGNMAPDLPCPTECVIDGDAIVPETVRLRLDLKATTLTVLP